MAGLRDWPAVVYKDTFLSFHQLNEQANQLARYLRSHGIGLGDRVGISLHRSLDLMVALLACMKCGACYVYINPITPLGRIQFFLEDAEINLLITKREILERIEHLIDNGRTAHLLDEEKGEISRFDTADLNLPLDANIPLCINYTATGNGTPSGVINHHYSALQRLNWMWSEYPFLKNEVMVEMLGLDGLDAVWELWGGLCQGVPLIFLPDKLFYDPAQFVPILANFKVYRLNLTPTLLRMLLAAFPRLGSRLPNLRYIITSGEPLSIKLHNAFRAAVPKGRVLSLYGYPESGGGIACYTHSGNIHEEAEQKEVRLIGRPFEGAELILVDGQGEPLDDGAIGEIYIRHTSTLSGYFNRPALNAERFKFKEEPDLSTDDRGNQRSAIAPTYKKESIFMTRDIGRRLANGSIEYLGRYDRVVNIRSQAVDLIEVENRLVAHPEVEAALVLPSENRWEDLVLVAYIKLSADAEEHSSLKWRTFLGDFLPTPSIPSYFVPLSKFPQLMDGKIDRDRLPDPTSAGYLAAVHQQNFTVPNGNIEFELTTIWKELLQLEKIGVYDDFFDLGGHSLSAIQMRTRIHEQLGVQLDPKTIFRQSTIGHLAVEIRSQLTSVVGSGVEVDIDTIDNKRRSDEALTLHPDPTPANWEEPTEAQTVPFVPIQREAITPIQVGEALRNTQILQTINPGQPGRPIFFCVHGGEGSVSFMKTWLPYLGDQPLYAFQAPGIDGNVQHIFPSVEEMAAEYISSMRQIQPAGPFALGGYGIGGAIAVEMANQLRENGQQVGLLLCIDSFHPSIEKRPKRLQARLRNLGNNPLSYMRTLVSRDRLANSAPAESIWSYQRDEKMIPLEKRDKLMTEYFDRLTKQKIGIQYDGAMTLLCAAEIWSEYSHAGLDRGWKGYVDKLKIHEIPGNHFSLLQPPNVDKLVTTMVRYIAQSQTIAL